MMKFTRRLLGPKNQKGIAILMAVFCVVLISYIVVEVTYESNIEYAIHAQSINRLKAYYAARSGLELSLLRIKIYKKIQAQLGKNAPGGMLNMIWSFPLNWPPVLPDEATAVDKDMIKDKVKESKMDSTFVATIFDEGSKIDLNDLDSPSKKIREATKAQLMRIFENLRLNDPDWVNKHQGFEPEKLVNNIIDWEDSNRESLNGGDESALYQLKNAEALEGKTYPPNRAFRSVEELRLVAGMKDEYYDLLSPQVTVYGAKAINPNTVTRDVLKYLDPSITDEIVGEILKRRDDPNQGGPFKDKDDFWNFVNSKGGRVTEQTKTETPLIFDVVRNFRIQSIGEYKNSIRQIDAIVFDLEGAASVVAEASKKEAADANPGATPTPAPGAAKPNPAANNQSASKGPPRIVYWFEK